MEVFWKRRLHDTCESALGTHKKRPLCGCLVFATFVPHSFLPTVPHKEKNMMMPVAMQHWDLSRCFNRNWIPPNYTSPIVESEFMLYHHRYFRHMERACFGVMMLVLLVGCVYFRTLLLQVLHGIGVALLLLIVLLDLWLCVLRKPRHHDDEVFAAFIHEYLVFAGFLQTVIILGILSYSISKSCRESGKLIGASLMITDDMKDPDVACVRAIYRYCPGAASLSVLCGRPRFFLLFPCVMAYIATTYLFRFIAPVDTMENMAFRIGMEVAVGSLILACCYFGEISHRTHFESYVRAFQARWDAVRRKTDIERYLMQLLPPMLYARLVSTEEYEDSSPCATVQIVSVTDLADWVMSVSSKEVAAAVSRVSSFVAALDSRAKENDIQRVRVCADQFIAVGNLLQPTMAHAFFSCVICCKRTEPCK